MSTIGCSSPTRSTRPSGYRYYHPGQLQRAHLISRLRSVTMPLADVAAVRSAADDAEADRHLAFWWAGEEHNTAVRRALVQSLRRDRVGGAGEDPDQAAEPAGSPQWRVFERQVPELLLLTEQRNIAAHQLPTYIGEAIRRLSQLTPRTPRTADTPVLAIYHGRVNEDSDGPVETCLVLDPRDLPSLVSLNLPPGTNLRREAAHPEPSVTLTKRQVVSPNILAAYDLVEATATIDNRPTTAPPREHYFTDFAPPYQTNRCATSPSQSSSPSRRNRQSR